jgi:Domain of unknown function (DUF5671)
MARNLYRFYLYTVFIVMLIFAAVGLDMLLQPLLSETPLRGSNDAAPTGSSIVQAVVFFVVSWVIAGLLGGLHYWLIRRDMRNDPAAGNSAIRAFFLNIAELIAVPLAVGISSFAVIYQLGRTYAGNVPGFAAFSLATFALVGVLELERQRTRADAGPALVFQRLHLYGVQLILLIFLYFAWFETVKLLIDAIVFHGQASGTTPCAGFTTCQGSNLLSEVVGLLWVVLFWVGYGYIARDERYSLLRQILHFASFAAGVIAVLYGVERGLELLLAPLFKIAVSVSDVLNTYDFTTPITFGLLVVGVYGLWIRSSARQLAAGVAVAKLIAVAITATLLAASFWWGCGLALLNVFKWTAATTNDWLAAIAFIITGLAYIPLDLYLHRRDAQDPATATGARRGFVFALLGGGTLALGIGLAVALYALGTSLLGSPLNDWQNVARAGASAFVIGGIMVGVYLWTARREQLFSGLVRQTTATGAVATPVPATPEPGTKPSSIEDVLDTLLAGKITRDEAVARIRAITDSKLANPQIPVTPYQLVEKAQNEVETR